MNRFKAIFFLVLFCASATFPQTAYYVSSSKGSDSNSGTSESSPFKTLSKVNKLDLKPGDKVLLKSGDIWEGQNLIIKDSGTESNRIVFSSYGSGEKPIITLREEVPGWKTANNWTKYSNNVYVMNFTCYKFISRLWLNNTEAVPAISPSGDNLDGTIGVNSIHKFYFDRANSKLYVYASENPSISYSSLKYPGKIKDDIMTVYTIMIKDADYTTIDGLDIQGGLYASIGIGNSDYVKINNCSIGKFSNFVAISTYGVSIGNTSDFGIISHNIIDSDWHYNLKYYTALTPEGIVIGDGATYWKINDNLIKDWWVSVFVISSKENGGVSSYHNIYNNEMTNPNFTAFGYPLVLSSDNYAENNNGYQYVNFFNNYCHNFTTGIELASSGNKIFNNIFAHYTQTDNEHDNFGHSGWGLSSFGGSLENADFPEDNYIFNNTFYDMLDYAYLGWGRNEYWYNNLFVNTGKNKKNVAVRDGSSSTKTWKNNLFYNSNTGTNSNMIIMDALKTAGSIGYSVKEFNNLNGQSNKVISGNIQYTGELSNLINIKDFSLPPGSPAINAGISISHLFGTNLIDILTSLIGKANPNIGAVNNISQSPTGLKIFLEGPYSNGSMSTSLNDQGLIPKLQPYNVSPWNYNGNESVSEIPNDIVDWVLVELRNPLSPSSTAVARKAAFLRDDGSITALDGVSKLSFGNLTGAYYVVVAHRNHLAVHSSLPVLLVLGNLEYDFTTSANKAYGSNAMTKLDDGVYGMYGGDTNGDGVIDDKDVTDVSSNLFKTGYQKEDVNLNSPVNVLDYKLPNENKSKSSQASSE